MTGFFGIGDFTKPGSGITNDPNKGRVKLFFEILGTRIWKLFTLNLIYILCCLPIVTIGPATAGMMKVVKNYAIDKNAFVWMDFKQAFKENFLKSFIVGIIDIIAYLGIYCGLQMYPAIAADANAIIPPAMCFALYVLTLSAAITFTIMNYYIYLMIVSTKLSLKQIIHNAMTLSFAAPKQNMISLLSSIVLPLIPVLLGILLQNVLPFMILLFAPATIVAFIIAYCCYPVIQKYVTDPYYEKTGEVNPEKPDPSLSEDDEDVLFKDLAVKEDETEPAPAVDMKKVRGKIIS